MSEKTPTTARRPGRPRKGSAYRVNGVWHIRATNPDGTRTNPIPMPPGTSEAMAREKAERLTELAKHAVRVDALPTGPAKTIATLVDRWVTLIAASNLAPATKKGHASHAKGPISDRFGKLKPEDITTAALRGWLRDLRASGSSSRARNIFFSLSKMLDDASAEGWVSVPNPCRHPKVREEVPAIEEPEDEGKARHTEAEASQLIRATTAPERRLRYLVAFTSLMRDGEIAGLRFMDLDVEKGVDVYRVRGALAREGDDGWSTRRATKTKAGRRLVPIHPVALAELKRWHAEGWRAYVGRDPKPEDAIFPDVDGTPWRPKSALLMRADLERAGLPTTFEGEPFEFRSTRRSGATWLEAHEVSSETADRIIGHASKSVRQKHYSAGDLDLMARGIASIAIDLGGEFRQRVSSAGANECPIGEHETPVEQASEALTRLAPVPVFKTGAGQLSLSWAGSIPVRFRQLSLARESCAEAAGRPRKSAFSPRADRAPLERGRARRGTLR